MSYQPIIEGGPNPCPHCPPIPTQAPLDKIIAVGFGMAALLKDGLVIIDGEKRYEESETGEDLFTFADAERLALADPYADWRVILNGPLHGETYQRHAPGVWCCIERNEGFA